MNNTDAIWYMGKAFKYPSTKPEDEMIAEFHGPDAQEEARAWCLAEYAKPDVDAAYLYEVTQTDDGPEKRMIADWSDTYGPDYADEESDDSDDGGYYLDGVWYPSGVY